MLRQLKGALDLGRIANLPTVWTNCVAALLLTSGSDLPAVSTIAFILIGASLMYTGGCTLNDVCDIAIDTIDRPDRTIPSGIISLKSARMLGISELAVGAALIAWPYLQQGSYLGIALALSLAVAIVVYDLIHKRSPLGIWVMGLCRALLWLCAGLLPNSKATPLLWLWAGLVLIYIAGVSLVARAESKPGSTRGAAILLFLPILAWAGYSPATRGLNPMHLLPSIGLPLSFGAVVVYAILMMKRNPPATIGPAVGWLLAAIPLLDAMAASMTRPGVACLLVAGLPMTRIMQKHFAST